MSEKPLQVLVIGCGSGGKGSGSGHSIAYAHANAYAASPRTEIAAACDLDAENLARFRKEYDVPEGDTDLARLLERVRPDLVSICTYVGSHAPIFDAVKTARPKGILMEKPFGLCMDDVRRMTRESAELGIKLAVNHFRRLAPAFAKVREQLDAGAIGDVQLITTAVDGWDQMEWGTHWLDMLRFFKNDQDVSWVFGQVECSGRIGEKDKGHRTVNYGHVVEEHSVNYLCFEDGTRGLLDAGKRLAGDAVFNFLGTEGALYLKPKGVIALVNGDGRQEIDGGSMNMLPEHAGTLMRSAIESLAEWADGGAVSPIAAENAAKSAELCLAAYESTVRRNRIDLPLGPQSDFPLNHFKQ